MNAQPRSRNRLRPSQLAEYLKREQYGLRITPQPADDGYGDDMNTERNR